MPTPEWMTHPVVGTDAANAAAAGSNVETADWGAHPLADAPPDWMTPLAPQAPLLGEQARLDKGVVQGLEDLPEGGAQLVMHGLSAVAPNNQTISGQSSAVDQFIKNQEASYAKNFPGGKEPSFDVGRSIGNMVAGAPVAYMMPGATAESLIARTLSNAAGGATTAAMQPVDPNNPNYWQAKAEQAGSGAAGGAAMAPIVGGAARVISPNVNPDVKTLLNEGVTPTPGQIAGGWFKDLEDKFTSIPGLGDAIKDAKLRAVGDLNNAAIGRSLSHIGQSLDPGTAPGREAIDQMHSKIGNAYDQLLPNLTWQADPQFVQNVTNIRTNANLLPDQQKTFDGLLKNQFSKAPNGIMDGQTYKDVESKIGQVTTDYVHSSDPDDRAVGRALQGVQGELKDALVRSNPQFAPQLNSINAAYADSLRVQGAAGRQGAFQGGDAGVFSPAQLSSSIRELDPTLRKNAFARGEARMQDLSDAGKSVLGANIPDSGTPGRGMAAMGLMALAGGGGEMLHLPPETVIPAVAAATGGMAAYTRPGQATLAALLARRPAIAAPIASVVRKAAPAATSGLASVLANQATAAP